MAQPVRHTPSRGTGRGLERLLRKLGLKSAPVDAVEVPQAGEASAAVAAATSGGFLAETDWALVAGAYAASGGLSFFAVQTGESASPVSTSATPPASPQVLFAPESDTGVAGDGRTRVTTPSFSGGGVSPGSQIRAVSAATGEAVTVTVDSNGKWSLTLVRPLPDGAADIGFVAIDAAGLISAPTTLRLVVDATAPAAPAAQAVSELIDTTPTITGSGATPGDTIQVTMPGTGEVLTARVTADGSWSVTATQPLATGVTLSIRMVAIDAEGNVSGETMLGLTLVNPVPPAPPPPPPPAAPVALLDAASDSGVLGDGLTNDTTPTISGTGAGAGNQIRVTMPGSGEVLNATAALDGSWSVTATQALTHGLTGTASVTQADANGTSAATNVALTIDTQAPSVPSGAIAAASDSGTSGDGITNDTTPTLSGSGATPGDTIRVTMPGTGEVLNATVGSNGTWTVTPSQALADGSSGSASLVARDPAGNASSSGSVAITIDATAPVATLTIGANVTASSSEAGTAYLVNGALAPTGVADILAAADAQWNSVAITSANGSATMALTGLADGSYRLYASDAAGNLSSAASGAMLIDTSIPTLNSLAISSATGILNSRLNASDVVAVTAAFSEAVTVTGSPQLELDLDGTHVQASYVSGSGTANLLFGYTILAGQSDADGIAIGANALALNGGTIKDAAGNNATLTSSAVGANGGYKVDTVAPTVAINSDKAALKTGETAAISFTFSEDPGTSFSAGDVSVSGGSLGAVAGTGLTRTATFTPTAGTTATASLQVTSGSYVDAAGNNGQASAAQTISIDTLAPGISGFSVVSSTGMSGFYLNAGDSLTFEVSLSEAVTLDQTGGAPTLTLDIGGSLVQASYLSAPTSTTLRFGYTILAGQNDSNGISVAANGLTLNGATLRDSSGNGVVTTSSAGSNLPGYRVDTAAPTIASVAVASGSGGVTGIFNSGDSLTFQVGFSETISGEASSRLAFNLGGATLYAAYASTSGAVVSYTYTLGAGLTDADGISFDANAFDANGATIVDQAGNAATLTSSVVAANGSFKVDSVAPTIQSLAFTGSSGLSNGVADAGDTVSLTATFAEAVVVTGSPQLTLDLDGTLVQASYVSGSGTSALTFSYTILAGQVDSDGISIPANAIGLNGGTIKDTGGTSATLTSSAVSANAAYKVDSTAPALAITSDKAALKAGETATISFSFSEDPGTSFTSSDISVSGGALGALSGSGLTRTATFTPSVSSTVNAIISVASGSYTDATGNGGGAGSVSISVDTQAPSVSITNSASSLKAGETATLSFSFSEDPGSSFALSDVTVTGGSLSNLAGSGLTRTATFTPTGNSSGTASFSIAAGAYTDAAGNAGQAAAGSAISYDTALPTVVIGSDVSALRIGQTAALSFTFAEDPGTSFALSDLSVTSGALSNFSGSGTSWSATYTPAANFSGTPSFSIAAGSFTDPAGNGNGATSASPISVDTIAPTLAITSDKSAIKAGETAILTFSFSEDPGSSFVLGDVSATGGSLSSLAGSGLTRTATFTPTAGATGTASFSVASGSYTDAAGNAGGAASLGSIGYDMAAPAVSSVGLTGSSGALNSYLNTGDSLTVSVTFDDVVTVSTAGGTPQIALNVGGSTVYATYSGGSGSATLSFGYTILSGQADANGIAFDANALSANGGTIRDSAGNDATLTHAGVSDNASYKVDAIAPTVSSAAITSATGAQNNSLNAGDSLTVTVTFGEAVSVDTSGGTPRIGLNIGGQTVYASYAGGSGTSALTFGYSITTGATDSDGISIDAGALSTNGGTIRDVAGNLLSTSNGAVAANASYLVDTTAPTTPTVTALLTNSLTPTISGTATLLTGETLGVTLNGASYAVGDGYLTRSGTNWSLAVPAGANLAAGTYSLVATVTDAAGNSSSDTTSAELVIDRTVPALSSLAITSATGASGSQLNAGDTLTVTATFGEAVVVTGAPQLALDIGGTTVQASYAGGSGTTALTFSYTIQSGQSDADGIAIGANALALNSGTIKDAAGNNATISSSAVAANTSYKVDTTAPAVQMDYVGSVLVNTSDLTYNYSTASFYRSVTSLTTMNNAFSGAAGALVNGIAGHVVHINSAVENSYINSTYGNVWMGVSDKGSEGSWAYYYGSNAGVVIWSGGAQGGQYNSWNSGEPNDSGSNEDGAVVNGGSWNDLYDGNSFPYVIEWDGSAVLNQSYANTKTIKVIASEASTVYAVKSGTSVTDVASITGQADSKWNSVSVATSNVLLTKESFDTISGWSSSAASGSLSPGSLGGEAVLGRFYDATGNQVVSKQFTFAAYANQTVKIDFDVYECDSWDGELFKIFVNDSVSAAYNMYLTTHSVDPWDGGKSLGELLGSGGSSWGEEIHHITLQVTLDGSGRVKLGFGSTLNEGIDNESWAIDNVTIATTASTTSLSLTGLETGNYNLYAADSAGNLSPVLGSAFTIA